MNERTGRPRESSPDTAAVGWLQPELLGFRVRELGVWVQAPSLPPSVLLGKNINRPGRLDKKGNGNFNSHRKAARVT